MIVRQATVKGNQTEDNRDLVAVYVKDDFHFYLLIDGATSSPNSGCFAKKIANEISTSLSEEAVIPTDLESMNLLIINSLKRVQRTLLRKHLNDVLSLLLVIQLRGRYYANSWGDCLLGKIDAGKIDWFSVPHTAANLVDRYRPINDLAKDEKRHVLTRSFRGRRYEDPDVYTGEIKNGEQFVLATDGFWAGVPQGEQFGLLTGGSEYKYSGLDDMSFIIFDCD